LSFPNAEAAAIDALLIGSSSYVYYTQIMQSETLATAYRLWRRNWKGLGREYTAGALVWQAGLLRLLVRVVITILRQINDCWPVTSWAIVDYFLRPKPAYFSIARELKAYTVGITRKDVQTFANKYTAADYAISTEMEIWGTNSSLVEKKAELEVTSFNLQSGWRETFTKEATLPPNQATELFQGPVPGQPVRTSTAEIKKDIVVSARLLDANGSVLARFSNWCVY
jgi:beta-mannosidase